jgi:DNA-binding NarL/FixJ family response regulator
MRRNSPALLVSKDTGLLKHWRNALKIKAAIELSSFSELQKLARRNNDVVWLDLNADDIPPWTSNAWQDLFTSKNIRLIAASSYPKDADAIAALDAGCAGYCHAFSDADTLFQVHQVTSAGHIWIGQHLMQQLIQSANRAKPQEPIVDSSWDRGLTARELEVARLAAHGASNLEIAEQCDITERTVKAHLSAVFEKTGVADRLQLALKVHGIR